MKIRPVIFALFNTDKQTNQNHSLLGIKGMVLPLVLRPIYQIGQIWSIQMASYQILPPSRLDSRLPSVLTIYCPLAKYLESMGSLIAGMQITLRCIYLSVQVMVIYSLFVTALKQR